MAKASQILARAKEEQRKNLLEPEARALCEEYGIPFTKSRVANTKEQAVKFAEELGYPVVIKIVSPDIIHNQRGSAAQFILRRELDELGPRHQF